jgi:glycosyltransferase involved in cell wall biosynthesis
MELKYRISVLIPCHSTNFLTESIASIQRQTLNKSIFEVVIVADRVDEKEVTKILEQSQLSFRIVSSSNPGIVSALNLGVSSISSDFIARMDEDDVMYPNRLEIQLAHLEKNANCVAVGGQLELIDEFGFEIGTAKFARIVGKSSKDLFDSSPIAHPAAMVRTGAISKIGGYRSFLPEDWDLWVRLQEIGELHNLSQKVLRYRIHGNQLSREKMYAKSHARLIVGTSHFARQAGLLDAPGTVPETEIWITEISKILNETSHPFRTFIKWTRKIDSYQDAYNTFAREKRIKLAIKLFVSFPLWFFRDILKKVFN